MFICFTKINLCKLQLQWGYLLAMQLLSYSRFFFKNSSYLQPYKNNSFNCKQFINITEIRMYSSRLRNFNRCRAHTNFKAECHNEQIRNMSYANSLLDSFKLALKRMPVFLRGHSMNIVKHCAEQCEFIIAHRIRRSQQIISLYTKIWDEIALKQFIIRLRRKLTRKGKFMLISATGIYNWNQERISDEEISRYQNEMRVVQELKQKQYCRQKKEGDKCTCFNCLAPTEKVQFSADNEIVKTSCNCETINSIALENYGISVSNSEPEWDQFVNEPNLIVWKKEESNHIGEGLFCYKLYGRYDDVTALDFLEAQVDLNYRLSWDDHAVKLHTIDTERSTRSDVIYWETKWPTPFSNRDYVFKRRYHIDKRHKLVTLVNKSTEHPSVPAFPNKQRVKEYWSYMVIKPFNEVDQPGLEFSLTYFDNPGMSMPSTLSSYVTVTGMPVFLKNLHDAAKSLKDKRKGPSILFDEDEDSDDSKSSKRSRKSKPPPSSSDDQPKDPNKKCPKLPDVSNYQRIYDGFFFF